MNKVQVRFDKTDGSGSIKLVGWAFDFPVEGKDFTIQVFKELSKVIVEFGRVINMKPLGDLFLIQTEFLVLEARFISDEGTPEAKVLEWERKGGVRDNKAESLFELLSILKQERVQTLRSGLKLVKPEETL